MPNRIRAESVAKHDLGAVEIMVDGGAPLFVGLEGTGLAPARQVLQLGPPTAPVEERRAPPVPDMRHAAVVRTAVVHVAQTVAQAGPLHVEWRSQIARIEVDAGCSLEKEAACQADATR